MTDVEQFTLTVWNVDTASPVSSMNIDASIAMAGIRAMMGHVDDAASGDDVIMLVVTRPDGPRPTPGPSSGLPRGLARCPLCASVVDDEDAHAAWHFDHRGTR